LHSGAVAQCNATAHSLPDNAAQAFIADLRRTEKHDSRGGFRVPTGVRLLPHSPEAIYRYLNLLLSCGRIDDAKRVASTAAWLEPGNRQLESLVTQLRQQKQSQNK
jgi:hypothetical protein